VTHYHHPSWTDDGSFRASLDDVIIIPFVFVGLAASKILRFILSLLMRLFDYAFTLAMQLVWLPLFAAKVLGDGIVAIINGVLHFLPLSETKLRQWSETIRRNWSWLRRKISYRAFEHAVPSRLISAVRSLKHGQHRAAFGPPPLPERALVSADRILDRASGGVGDQPPSGTKLTASSQ
jgi:hypothetical protein